MTIDFANLDKAFKEHEQEFKEATLEVMSSARYILGKETDEFEEKLREFTGSSYALGCSSKTDVLLLALMALGVRSRNEIITTPFTYIAASEIIACLRTKPVPAK